jgi:hypothetical protein
VVSDLPADDLAGEQVGDERRVRKTAGRGHISDIRDPAAVRRGRSEVPFQQVSRPLPGGIWHRGPRLLPLGGCPGDSHLPHQPFRRAPRHLDALTAQLQPHFPRPIQPPAFPAVLPHAHDMLFQLLVPGLTR